MPLGAGNSLLEQIVQGTRVVAQTPRESIRCFQPRPGPRLMSHSERVKSVNRLTRHFQRVKPVPQLEGDVRETTKGKKAPVACPQSCVDSIELLP